jgi:hypothetical protein
MEKIISIAFLILIKLNVVAQIANVEEQFTLPGILSESSGVIFFNDKLITHNDSGNSNELYELDTVSESVTRTITIDNASNLDWEDLTQDNSFIYIGDIGNNNGNRTDLKIYKIDKTDFLNSTNVTAEIINFNYSDQTDFTSNPNDTEWDSEALIALDTSLIVLTKNWVTGVTKAYPIPKDNGTYSVDPLATHLTSGGLITGSTYNQLTEKIYSVGYSEGLQPFVWISQEFTGNDIFSGTNTQVSLSSIGLEQVEAITHIGTNRYFMTSESFSFSIFSEDAKLMSFTTIDTVLSIDELSINQVRLYPNPTSGKITIDFNTMQESIDIRVLSLTGQTVVTESAMSTNRVQLTINEEPGIYFVEMVNQNNQKSVVRIARQ